MIVKEGIIQSEVYQDVGRGKLIDSYSFHNQNNLLIYVSDSKFVGEKYMEDVRMSKSRNIDF